MKTQTIFKRAASMCGAALVTFGLNAYAAPGVVVGGGAAGTPPRTGTPMSPNTTVPNTPVPNSPNLTPPSNPNLTSPTSLNLTPPSNPNLTSPNNPNLTPPANPNLTSPNNPNLTPPGSLNNPNTPGTINTPGSINPNNPISSNPNIQNPAVNNGNGGIRGGVTNGFNRTPNGGNGTNGFFIPATSNGVPVVGPGAGTQH